MSGSEAELEEIFSGDEGSGSDEGPAGAGIGAGARGSEDSGESDPHSPQDAEISARLLFKALWDIEKQVESGRFPLGSWDLNLNIKMILKEAKARFDELSESEFCNKNQESFKLIVIAFSGVFDPERKIELEEEQSAYLEQLKILQSQALSLYENVIGASDDSYLDNEGWSFLEERSDDNLAPEGEPHGGGGEGAAAGAGAGGSPIHDREGADSPAAVPTPAPAPALDPDAPRRTVPAMCQQYLELTPKKLGLFNFHATGRAQVLALFLLIHHNNAMGSFNRQITVAMDLILAAPPAKHLLRSCMHQAITNYKAAEEARIQAGPPRRAPLPITDLEYARVNLLVACARYEESIVFASRHKIGAPLVHDLKVALVTPGAQIPGRIAALNLGETPKGARGKYLWQAVQAYNEAAAQPVFIGRK